MSPGDGLVIDDPSMPTKPPPPMQTPPLQFRDEAASSMPASDLTSVLSQQQSKSSTNLFMTSPSSGMVQSPQITADDLFDEAVS